MKSSAPSFLPVPVDFASLKLRWQSESASPKLKVCLLSPHPMVLDEFRRLLDESGFQIVSRQLDSMLAPDLRNLEVPRASVYVIDAHAARQATGALWAISWITTPQRVCLSWATT